MSTGSRSDRPSRASTRGSWGPPSGAARPCTRPPASLPAGAAPGSPSPARVRAAPFGAINCAAIADSLFEAELFGHARGAFTGADRARPGLLARAEGGTLFLDEIGELPLTRQATLLRALESRRYRAVGSDDERP